ncbi:hypothetical protein ZWY2020_054555 [Hordeum vulgare]|nr:hypothetical protein ZWY2020_054555 [Hordeum vulgare]
MVKGCTSHKMRLYAARHHLRIQEVSSSSAIAVSFLRQAFNCGFGLRRQSKSNQYETVSLVQIEGVNTREDVAWYGGKIMCHAASRDGERGDQGCGGGAADAGAARWTQGCKVRVFMYPSII